MNDDPVSVRPRLAAAVLVGLAAVLLTAAPSEAATVWPGSSGWTALESGGSPMGDSDGPNPDTTDVRGDAAHPAAFGSYDAARGNLFFRIRLDKDPGAVLTSVWQVLLDTDGDSGIDWVLQLDESGDNQMELVATTTEGPAFQDVVISTTSSWSGATATFSRIVATNDGFQFGSAADVFLDLSIPYADFQTFTGLSTTDAFRAAISTSTTHTGINKDFPLALSAATSVSSGWSDAFAAADIQAVPEPGTWALFGLGLGGLVWARARRRRRRSRPAADESAA